MKPRIITCSLCLALILVSSFDVKAFLAHGPIELSIGLWLIRLMEL